MSLHCNDTPKQGLLERLEASDPRDVADDAIAAFYRRFAAVSMRFADVHSGKERDMFIDAAGEGEYIEDHLTPAAPTALDQHRHNQDVRRKVGFEEQAA